MSRAHSVLGQAIAPRVGFATSHPRKPRVGQHLPNAREIGTAFAAWRRAQPIRPGSSYYETPLASSRNPNPSSQ